MIRLKRGTTRTVVVAGPFAVKLARGRVGRRCNLCEARIWELNKADVSRRDHLAPVLWYHRGGVLLVMAAASPLPAEVEPTEDWADWWDYEPARGPCDEWPGEFKREDWGVLDGRRVLIDYSAPALAASSAALRALAHSTRSKCASWWASKR